jgi:muconolactone D-isomerase
MEFLVHIEVQLPPDVPPDERTRLVQTESERGQQLIRDGKLKGIWRVPGRWANVSLYEAADATELHDLLSSLPLFPWLDIEIEALARHPLADHLT